MSTYLVLKRFKHQGIDNMPGSMITGVESASILMERGFISPVPDNFTPPPATTRARASESAGSGARRPSTKAEPLPRTSAVTIGTPVGSGQPNNQTNSPLPTVKQALEAGYSQEAAERMARGEFDPQDENETKALEEAMNARPEILDLARATEESLGTLLKESDEDYKELVRTFLTAPGAGTVGAAEDTGASTASIE